MNIISTRPSRRLQISENELCAWFGQAATGDTLTYHRGSLAFDRSSISSQLPRQEQAELARVARRTLALAEAGMATLIQMRHAPDDYEYRIVVKPRPPSGGDALARVLAAELETDGCDRDVPVHRVPRQLDMNVRHQARHLGLPTLKPSGSSF